MILAQAQPSLVRPHEIIRWEKLPADFELPDDPVENTEQPLLAAALREALELAGQIQAPMLVASNFGLCARVGDKTVVKAPDWVYIASVFPMPQGEVRRSYTPHAEGSVPEIVMEFLSDTDGGEYSLRPLYPYGKWYFYEHILEVPFYIIFEPTSGLLQVHHLISGSYQLQPPDASDRYWIEPLGLFLGVWQGTKAERTSHWLRWWDASGTLLLWGAEQVAQERQRAEQERQRAERLASQLQALGIDPNEL